MILSLADVNASSIVGLLLVVNCLFEIISTKLSNQGKRSLHPEVRKVPEEMFSNRLRDQISEHFHACTCETLIC